MSQPYDETHEQRRRALLVGLAVLLVVLLLALVARAVVGGDSAAAPPGPAPTTPAPSGSSSGDAGVLPQDDGTSIQVPVEDAPDGFAVEARLASAITLGRAEPMSVGLQNTTSRPLVIDALTVTAGTPDRRGCRASWLELGAAVPDPAGRILAPGATLTATVEVLLRDLPAVNQDACQGATFPVRVQVTGGGS